MIGQEQIKSRFSRLISENKFPRFLILVGPKGSGRKTLVHWIYQEFGESILSVVDISVDAVRQSVTNSYLVGGSKVIYLFADADTMSNEAKNALLKVTEETPNNSYFIITLEDESNTLATIRSRAQVFHMDTYSPNELEEYVETKYGENTKLYVDICDTPGEIDTLYEFGIEEFYQYVVKVVDNIARVSGANAFKISNKIALRDETDKYDLRLFWKAFMTECFRRAESNIDDILYNMSAIDITSSKLRDLRIKGVNKQMLFDMWLLSIRECWR